MYADIDLRIDPYNKKVFNFFLGRDLFFQNFSAL